jgi:hypothetical protein
VLPREHWFRLGWIYRVYASGTVSLLAKAIPVGSSTKVEPLAQSVDATERSDGFESPHPIDDIFVPRRRAEIYARFLGEV